MKILAFSGTGLRVRGSVPGLVIRSHSRTLTPMAAFGFNGSELLAARKM
jgi:hypothetical protein